MSVFELFELLIAYENRLDVQWGVFITVHLALFGGIIYIDRPLKPVEKVATAVIYSGFAAINYLVSQDLAQHIHAAQIEIAKLAELPCCSENALVQRVTSNLAQEAKHYTFLALSVSHGVMYISVLLSVLFDRSRKHASEVTAFESESRPR